jgi:hypothetical protein
MEVQFHSSLTLALHGGEQTTSHLGHFILKQVPQYPLNRWLGGPQGWSGCFGEEKVLLALLGFEPLTVQLKAKSLYHIHFPGSCTIGHSSTL